MSCIRISYLCICWLIVVQYSCYAGDSIPSKKQFHNPLEYQKGRFEMSIYPVSSIDPASGLELGVMPVVSISPKKDSISEKYYRSTSITSHITYSTKYWANFRIEGQMYNAKGFSIVPYCQYLRAPDYFYGIGNDSLNKTPSKYLNRYFKTGIELTKCFKMIYFVGCKIDFHDQNFSEIEGNYLTPSVAGYDGGQIIGFGPVFKIDSRDNVNFPSKGMLLQTAFTNSEYLNKSGKSFSNITVDYRKYCRFLKSYFLAFQSLVSSSSGDVPFYKMPSIGGKYNLRGISNRLMYIDKNEWFVQAEIRKVVYKRIGVVAFGGVGNVFANWNPNIVSHVKSVYGFGGRYQILPHDKINLRFDYAFGPNGDHGFYATIREAF